MPRVSVIIPVYNVEKYLRRCLTSVLEQSFRDIEIICIDDGSTDHSLSILQEFVQKDQRVKLIAQENQGASVARNNGFAVAQGEWTIFVDSDDAIHPQTIDICLDFARRYQADLVCFQFEKSLGGAYSIKELKRSVIETKVSDNPLELAVSKSDFRIPFSVGTKFYKTDIIRDIPFIKGIYYEDAAHTCALLSRHIRTVVLDAKLYFYTQNMASVSHLQPSIKQLQNYKTVMFYINDVYLKSPYSKDIEIVRRHLFPKFLRHQYTCCENASYDIKERMYRFFAELLRDYKSAKMIDFWGCGPLRYFQYLRIMKKY